MSTCGFKVAKRGIQRSSWKGLSTRRLASRNGKSQVCVKAEQGCSYRIPTVLRYCAMQLPVISV